MNPVSTEVWAPSGLTFRTKKRLEQLNRLPSQSGLSHKNLFRPELGRLHLHGDKKAAILMLIQVQSLERLVKSGFFHALNAFI